MPLELLPLHLTLGEEQYKQCFFSFESHLFYVYSQQNYIKEQLTAISATLFDYYTHSEEWNEEESTKRFFTVFRMTMIFLKTGVFDEKINCHFF